MANFVPSKYQQAIYDEMRKAEKNIAINALAGSGKTTTILNSLNILPASASKIFLAFNKSIVEELKSKVNAPNTEVKTLHSAGFSAMAKIYKSRLDNYKYSKFLRESLYLLSTEITVDTPTNLQEEYRKRVLDILGLSRAGLLETKEQIEETAVAHDIEVLNDEADVVLKLMDWGKNKVDVIDFTDMIWIPVVRDLTVRTYDWVLIDECQDLSPMQKELFLKMINPKNGRFVAVGDPNQSIYYFAAADNDSFHKIASISNTITLPLSICYRCNKEIIKKAQTFVPNIEAKDNAEDGTVNFIVEDEKFIENLKDSDMVLSRVNAPLTKMCFKAIQAGKAAYVKGRDIGNNLISLIKRTKQIDVIVMLDFLQQELYKTQVKVAQKNGITMEEAKENYAYISLADKIACIHVLSFGCDTAQQLISKIESVFKDTSKGICFSSIHKSKGLEADNVFILLYKWGLNTKNSVQAQQEANLQYVSITRAKKCLTFVDNCKGKNKK